MDFIENITWVQFFTNVIIVAVLYYITVILMYFRKDLPKYLPKQFVSAQKKLSFEIQQGEESEAEDIFRVASKASSAIKGHTRNDSNKHQNKKELLFSLHLILKSYAVLRYTPFEQAISNLIATEVDDQFSFNLEDEELNSVWMG